MRRFLSICAWALAFCVGSVAAAEEDGEGATREGEPSEQASEDEGGGDEAHLPPGEVIDITAPARPSAITASARDLEASEIALTPTRHPGDLLELSPGLRLGRHGAEGKSPEIFLRGFDAAHGSDVEVRVAGVPLNELSNIHGQGYLDLGFLIPEVVRSVRVRKGALGAGQGPFATAGTVEFELGVPEAKTGYQLGYDLGSTNRHRAVAVAAPAGGRGDSFLAAEAMRDDGFGTGREAARGSAVGSARVSLPGEGFADLWGLGYAGRFGGAGPVPLAHYEDGRVGFYDTYEVAGTGTSRRAIAGARARAPVGEGRLELDMHGQWRDLALDENHTGYFEDPEKGDRRGEAHRFTAAGFRARYDHPIAKGFSLRAGLEGLADRFRQAREALSQEGERLALSDQGEGTHLRGSAGLSADLAVQRARAEIGLRADGLRASARDPRGAGEEGAAAAAALSPRASLSYAPAAEWVLAAGYGHGARPPSARAAAAGEGAEFAWMRSRGGEVGARYRPFAHYEFGASAFGVWVPSELIFDHVAGEQIDEGATRRLGFELSAEARPADWLSLRADASAVRARFAADGARVPGAPRLFASAEARARHESGLRGGARLTAVDSRPLGSGAAADPEAALDVLVGYAWRSAEVTLQIENATNARLADGVYYYPSNFDRDSPRSELPRIHYSAGPPLIATASLRYAF